MRTDNPIKHFVVPFLMALLIYAVAYSWIEHQRIRKGAWQLTFTNGVAGEPAILLNQHSLGLTNVQLSFPGEVFRETNNFSTLVLSEPRQVPYEVPFGQCIFM